MKRPWNEGEHDMNARHFGKILKSINRNIEAAENSNRCRRRKKTFKESVNPISFFFLPLVRAFSDGKKSWTLIE
jgi:hypothetical protein